MPRNDGGLIASLSLTSPQGVRGLVPSVGYGAAGNTIGLSFENGVDLDDHARREKPPPTSSMRLDS